MSARRRRARDDRGATLIELALILPLLALLAFGTLEFGLAWRDSLTISNALRSGARVGSNAGDDRLADYNVLKQVESAIRDIDVARIERVVIYKADDLDGVAPQACIDGTPQAGVCNVYTAAQMDSLAETDFTDPDCSGEPDGPWCPTTREDRQVIGGDYLGVWVKVHREWITGLFPPTTGLTMTDSAVMRLEPRLVE